MKVNMKYWNWAPDSIFIYLFIYIYMWYRTWKLSSIVSSSIWKLHEENWKKYDETQSSTNFHSIKPVVYTFSQQISPQKKLSSHPDFSLNSVFWSSVWGLNWRLIKLNFATEDLSFSCDPSHSLADFAGNFNTQKQESLHLPIILSLLQMTNAGLFQTS